jgi:hypothetical protein
MQNDDSNQESVFKKHSSTIGWLLISLLFVIGFALVTFSVFEGSDKMSRFEMSFGISLYFAAIALIFNGAFSQRQRIASEEIKREIRQLSQQINRIIPVTPTVEDTPLKETIAPEKRQMTHEEIAGKTLYFQTFQLSILVTIAMASFTAAFFKDYGPVTAIIGGGIMGFITCFIAQKQIKKMGFKRGL